jgi:hypothetical protein
VSYLPAGVLKELDCVLLEVWDYLLMIYWSVLEIAESHLNN